MSSEIDKLFRDKLSNRAFPWKDAYWEQAEAAIIAAERAKRRRRFFFLFWLSGFAVVGLAAALWFVGRPPVEVGYFPIALAKQMPCEYIEMTSFEEEGEMTSFEEEGEMTSFEEEEEMTSFEEEEEMTSFEEEEEMTSFEEMTSLSVLVEVAFDWEEGEEEKSFPLPSPLKDNRRPSFGVAAGTSFDRQLGAWAGMAAQGRIWEKLGWLTGLHYGMNWLEEEELGRSRQVRRDFGATTTEYVLTATSEHRLEAPLGLYYSPGRRIQLEAGVLLSCRTGRRGTLTEIAYPMPWERSLDEQTDYAARLASYYADQTQTFPELEREGAKTRGWLPADGQTAFAARPFIGVQAKLGPSFALTGRAYYKSGVSAGLVFWIF